MLYQKTYYHLLDRCSDFHYSFFDGKGSFWWWFRFNSLESKNGMLVFLSVSFFFLLTYFLFLLVYGLEKNKKWGGSDLIRLIIDA